MDEEPLFEMQPPRTWVHDEKIAFLCLECNIFFESNQIGEHAWTVHRKKQFIVTNIATAMNRRKGD